MAEKIIFWIGALAIGLNTIRFTWCLTGVFSGWMLRKFDWKKHYLYFSDPKFDYVCNRGKDDVVIENDFTMDVTGSLQEHHSSGQLTITLDQFPA